MSSLRDEPCNLIFAMKQPYLDLLLCGKKTVELRRSHPARSRDPFYEWNVQKGNRIYLYYRGCVWGEVSISDFNFQTNMDYENWDFKEACLTQAELCKYMKGCKTPAVYFVVNPIRYVEPVKVDCRPQSWIYALDDSDFRRAREKALKGKEGQHDGK